MHGAGAVGATDHAWALECDKCSPVTGKGAEPLHSLRPNYLIARTQVHSQTRCLAIAMPQQSQPQPDAAQLSTAALLVMPLRQPHRGPLPRHQPAHPQPARLRRFLGGAALSALLLHVAFPAPSPPPLALHSTGRQKQSWGASPLPLDRPPPSWSAITAVTMPNIIKRLIRAPGPRRAERREQWECGVRTAVRGYRLPVITSRAKLGCCWLRDGVIWMIGPTCCVRLCAAGWLCDNC